MRRNAVAAAMLTMLAVLAGIVSLLSLAGPAGRQTPETTAATKVIHYRGLRLSVPGGWPVYRLDREPERCVRFDRHAVYLGRPGAAPDCPARLVGRTEALHIHPLETPGGRPVPLARYVVPDTVERQVRLPLLAAGVVVIATYGAGRLDLQRILRGAGQLTWWPETLAAGYPAAARRPATPDGRPRRRRAWTTGRAFDTCATPPLPAMAAWRNAYGTMNINIGGAARGCAQPNLSRHWVRSTRRMGYRLIPTYVGLQAPCNDRFENRFTVRRAAVEGRRAADDAVRRARELGIRRRAPIYFDMESYDSRKAWCRDAVLLFLHEWTRRLHRHHYRSGVYSSVASGIRDLGSAEDITKPNAIWFAHWDGEARVHGSPYLSDRWWTRHRRIKQYEGGHKEKHGGVTINIDSNVVDGLVY
ncbi:MAG: DUF1906 domain-containing protein [Actinomadura sp.]